MRELFCLFPIFAVMLLSVITKNVFLSLLIGVILGLFLLNISNPLIIIDQFIQLLYQVLMSKNTIWVILICLFFGALNKIISESGGIEGIERWIQKICQTRTKTMLGTWLLSLTICISEYLSALTVGMAFRKSSDKNKISREMFAYIINVASSSICAIIPISDMAVFMSGLMVSAGLISNDSILHGYIQTIPYILFGLISIVLVPLFILKVIPLFGPMKQAEQRTISTGKVLEQEIVVSGQSQRKKDGKILNFFIPILTVFIMTIITNDILIGVFISLIVSFIVYTIQKVMTVNEFLDNIVEGMKEIFSICITITLAYMLVEINQQLGMVEFLSSIILQSIPKEFLPVMIFVFLGILSNVSGSFWGLAAIAFPLIGVIVNTLHANPFLCSGALISAVTFGTQSCLYSDTVMVSSVSTQLNNVTYFKTSFPLIFLSFILSAIGYLILGFI